MINKILIIKGRETSPSGVAEKFISQGYHVDLADDLALARRLLEASEHCAVVIDRQLTEASNADGIEMLSYIRNRFSGARVIVMDLENTRLRNSTTTVGSTA